MKILSNFRFLFMVAAASFMLVSCGEDLIDGGGGSETQTTLNLQAGPDLVTSVTTVPFGATFSVNLVATAGDDAMNRVEVLEDGVSIPITSNRLSYDGAPAAANPRLLFNDDKSNFDYQIQVVAHTEVGTRTYRFSVVDDAGDEQSVSVDVTTVGDPPVLTLEASTVQNVVIGTLNAVRLTAVKGAGAISSIGVSVDGVLLEDITSLSFGSDFISNPHPLEGALAEGFSMQSLQFRAPAVVGMYEYVITITDEFGQESSVNFTANAMVASTPVESFPGTLFSAEGDDGTGGLDLDNGTGTGSSDMEAEIRDLGFADNGSWDQQIAPVNGSRLFLFRPGMENVPTDFDFDDIDTKEFLAGLFAADYGLEVLESGTVVVGQIYMVVREGNIYAFQVEEVNVIANSNDDNYVLNIVK